MFEEGRKLTTYNEYNKNIVVIAFDISVYYKFEFQYQIDFVVDLNFVYSCVIDDVSLILLEFGKLLA